MVSVQPAEASNWSAARAELIVEAKRPLKAQLAAELSACNSDEESADVRARFEAAERDLEHSIDHKPLEANIEMEVQYQFRTFLLQIQIECSHVSHFHKNTHYTCTIRLSRFPLVQSPSRHTCLQPLKQTLLRLIERNPFFFFFFFFFFCTWTAAW